MLAHTHEGRHGARNVLTVMNVVLIKWSLDVVWTPPREDAERNWIGCWSGSAVQGNSDVFSLEEMKDEADGRIK